MSLGRKIKSWIDQNGAETAIRGMESLVKENKINPSEVSLRDLAENVIGYGWDQKMQRAIAENPQYNPYICPHIYRGQESGDAVDASAFSAITGNLLIDKVYEGYNSPAFIGDQLCETIPVTHGNLDTIKEPWLGMVGSPAGLLTSLDDTDEDEVDQGKEYQASDFQGNYVLLARPKKHGRRCDVTFEMIYSDRTRQAYKSAESVGNRVGRIKEYRILKCVAGLTNNFRYSWNGSAEQNFATYVTVDGATASLAAGSRWVNALDSTPLVNWADLNTVEQLFNQMRDPNTGEPIDVDANTILVMPGNVHNARHILFSTQIRTGPGGSTDTTVGPNTVNFSSSDLKQYNLLSSKYLYKLLSTSGLAIPSQDYTEDSTTLTVTAAQAAQFWWVANFKKAFYYRQVYPMRVVQAPPMNPMEFDRDIVVSVKAQEFGTAGILDPHYVVRCAGHDFESQSD